jgi:hypothetical protein
MSLERPIEQVVEADLRALIENQVSERKTVEYKQALPGKSNEEKKEFLADVSSFANASGGHLVYGMKEEEGLPVELCGLDADDTDSIVTALDSSIRDGVKPRIPGVVVWPVPLTGGKRVIVIRVPKSFASPHMVTFANTSRFYARNSNGKYQLDIDEIRAEFLFSDRVAERIREFRLDRIANIDADQTPVPLPGGGRLVLHVVPLSAFSVAAGLEPRWLAELHPDQFPLFPLANHGWTSQKFNFEGLVRYTGSYLSQQDISAYIQVFRNGILEGVDASLLMPYHGKLLVPSVAFEEGILGSARNYLSSLQRLRIDPPFALMLSLLRVSGYQISFEMGGHRPVVGAFDRDTLLIPEQIIEGFDADLPSIMKQTFDMVWNAAGWARSLCYDQQGQRRTF